MLVLFLYIQWFAPFKSVFPFLTQYLFCVIKLLLKADFHKDLLHS